MLPLALAVPTICSRLRSRLVPAAFALGLCLAGSASAVDINVTGVVGSGTTTWQFSGTTEAWAIGPDGDGDFALGTNSLFGRLNNFQGADFESDPFGSFSETNVALSTGASVTGSNSGLHLLEGFTFESLPRFAWFADGAFNGGGETLTYLGMATAGFEISKIDGINGLGDFETVIANDNVMGNLTMTFTAVVPEPSTALLLGLGLLAMGARRRV